MDLEWNLIIQELIMMHIKISKNNNEHFWIDSNGKLDKFQQNCNSFIL